MPQVPELLIVSGPNGSGKTTLAEKYAAEFAYPYIAADRIAAQLKPDDPSSQRIEAGRKYLSEIHAAVSDRQSVVVESTLSGRMFARTIEAAKAASFTISIVHLFLDSADTCVERVLERVAKGGHDVPEIDVRRRFVRSAVNFWGLYRPLCDRWMLVYNATTDAQPVGRGDPTAHSIQDSELFEEFMRIVRTND